MLIYFGVQLASSNCITAIDHSALDLLQLTIERVNDLQSSGDTLAVFYQRLCVWQIISALYTGIPQLRIIPPPPPSRPSLLVSAPRPHRFEANTSDVNESHSHLDPCAPRDRAKSKDCGDTDAPNINCRIIMYIHMYTCTAIAGRSSSPSSSLSLSKLSTIS